MSSDDNVKTIQSVYEAFGRGDIPTDPRRGHRRRRLGHRGRRHRRTVVGPARTARTRSTEFFEQFAGGHGTGRVHAARDRRDGDAVLTRRALPRASRAATGTRGGDGLLHHYLRFRDGKIAYYRGAEDTLQTLRTLQ